ncbi:MAG: C39 family peptidase [Chloroflexi bacterium]|nr:C39 family peptidase [Chloroflexota bacterium]
MKSHRSLWAALVLLAATSLVGAELIRTTLFQLPPEATTQPPTTQPPTTQPPTTQPPTAQPPTAQPPTAQLATTQPPTAQPPTAQPPTAQPLLLVLPTATAVPSFPATVLPTAAIEAPPAAVQLTGIRHEWQTWNNCGPATLAMNLSYYGSTLGQAAIGGVLRTSPDDKNVSPYELVNYATSQGYVAHELVNGNPLLLRTLLANGVPVVLETWYERADGEGIGHYRLLVGYDDATAQWTLYDSLDAVGLVSFEPYGGIRVAYDQLAEWWKVFNHTFLLVYPPEREAQVSAILGQAGLDKGRMWADAEQQARTDLAADQTDRFAWFNLGSSLTEQGRYAEAAAAFDQARALGLPKRMLWYQHTPFEAYVKTGRAQDVLAISDVVLEETTSVEEIFYWRGRALLALGDPAAALDAAERALELAPQFVPALELRAELTGR